MTTALRPLPGPPRPYSFPGFHRTRLASGMTVIGCDLPGRPLGCATLILEAGAENEPASEGGVAGLAARALTEGTQVRDAAAFAEAAERLGAEIQVRADWDSFRAAVEVPMARMEPALELVAEAVRSPAFPASEVDRVRRERLDAIRQEMANPMQRAALAFPKVVYAPASPYARAVEGTPETVEPLDRETVERYYRRFATPGSATLIVAGDFGRLDPERMAERLFAGWEAPEPERPAPAIEETIAATAAWVVNRPGAVQSQIVIGHAGVQRSAPDYHALRIVETALGGLFNSRLMTKLREEKGYTYFAVSSFSYRRGPGPFACRAAPRTAVTVDAVADTIEEIRRLHADGLAQAELDAARDFQAGVAPLRFETPGRIAEAIAQLAIYGLPDDHYDAFGPALRALTLDEVNRVARERLRPDRLAVVVVGDAGEVEAPLRAAGFGPVTVVEDPPGA